MNHYLLEIQDDETLIVYGPYPNTALRDLKARRVMRNSPPGNTRVFAINPNVTRRSKVFQEYETAVVFNNNVDLIFVKTTDDDRPLHQNPGVIIQAILEKMSDAEIELELKQMFPTGMYGWGRIAEDNRLPDV